MHFTQNPIGSDDQLDLQDNAISFDYAMNSPAALWQDRFGKQHKTVQQALKDVGFKPAGFDFVTGGTLGIGDRDKCVFYPTNGYWYSWNGKLPYVVPVNSSPTPGGRKGWGVVTRDESVVAREALRRTYQEAGYNLVEGSFEQGGVLNNQNDVLLQERTGKVFSGDVGPVPAGTNPASVGFVDVSSKLYRDRNYIFNVTDYGASPLNSGEQNHIIFLLVEDLAKTVGGRVFVPPGIFLRAGDTVMDGRYALCGAHNAVQNHGDTKGSIIKYVGNYGTKVLDSANVLIEDLAFQQTGGTDATGIDLQAAGRSALSRVTVDGFAGNGINAVNGNLSSYTDIICLNNGGDGFKMGGLATPDINCASLRNIDARGNTGIGINLDSAWNVMGFGLVAQSNSGYGVVVNNCRQSFLIIYSENNTGGSIHYTNHANNEGNFIIESFVDVASIDDSKGENTILKSKTGADTWSMFEEMTCKSLVIPNISASGVLRLKHDTSARHDFYAEKTGQSQTLRWKNVANLANIDADAPLYPFIHHFIGAVVRRDRLSFANGDTGPNVSLSEFWLANNTAATTITSFAGGVDGQKIMVVFNNGNTTIQHSSTNTGVRLKGGVTKAFAQYEGATFVKNGTNWWIEV